MAQIHHVVLLKFKPQVSAQQIDEAFQQLAQLKEKIPGITYFAGGAYSSHEGLNRGFTHGMLMTFDSPRSRDAYLPHPEHVRVRDSVLPLVEEVVAFDFEAPASGWPSASAS